MQILEKLGITGDELRGYGKVLLITVAEVTSALTALAAAKALNSGPDVSLGIFVGENAVAGGGLWVFGRLRSLFGISR